MTVTGVTAERDERAGWVLVGIVWAYPSRIWLWTEVDGFAVRMPVLVADDGPQVCELVVQQPRMALGSPLTQPTRGLQARFASSSQGPPARPSMITAYLIAA